MTLSYLYDTLFLVTLMWLNSTWGRDLISVDTSEKVPTIFRVAFGFILASRIVAGFDRASVPLYGKLSIIFSKAFHVNQRFCTKFSIINCNQSLEQPSRKSRGGFHENIF